VFFALRYYWVAAKGYRLRPWRSPYIRWRMETFFGHEADAARESPREFFRLMWRERDRMRSFLHWAAQRERAQRNAAGRE